MSSMFGVGFKASKCKTLLRLAMARIKLLRNKRDTQVKQMRKDIAQLLQTGQEPSARIRVEHIAREQNIMAAYDILELFCELIIVRLPIIEAQKVCPLDLKEAVSSLVFASPRCADLPELLQIRTLFGSKYGKEFIAGASELRPECGVNRRIIEKLSVRAPPGEVKLKLLTEIAAEYNVEWDPANSEAELLKRPEDLLDGPKQFLSPSQTPLPHMSASPTEPAPTRKTSTIFANAVPPPPPPPSAPSVPSVSISNHETPLDESSSEASSPEARSSKNHQYIPFVQTEQSKRVSSGKFESPPTAPGNHSGFPSTSGGRQHEQAKKEGQRDHDKSSKNFENVEAAVKAAAESADRAVAAARAAAQLARGQSSISRETPARVSQNRDSSSEGESDDGSPRGSSVSSRMATKSKEDLRATGLSKRSEPEKRNEKPNTSFSSTLGSGQEFSFRRNVEEERQSSAHKGSSSRDQQEANFRRSFSQDQREPSSVSDSDDDSEPYKRRSGPKDIQEASFRRKSSVGSRGHFRRDSDGEHESSLKSRSDDQTEEPPNPIRRFDSENETFWQRGDREWDAGVDSRSGRKSDESGLRLSRYDEDDFVSQRSTNLFTRNDSGDLPAGRNRKDESYSNASNIFSRRDSAESSLFKRSDSTESDLRSSDETPFYDSKPGFAPAKYDEDELPSVSTDMEFMDQSEDLSKRNSNVNGGIFSEDPFRRISSLNGGISNSFVKPSFHEPRWTDTLAQNFPEDEAIPKKIGLGRERITPEKVKPDMREEASDSPRHATDPPYSKSYVTGEDSHPPKNDPPVPSKSRRTRVLPSSKSRDKFEGGGGISTPAGGKSRPSSEEVEDSSHPGSMSPFMSDNTPDTSSFSPPSSPPLRYSPTPPGYHKTTSSAHHSSEINRESTPPSMTRSGSDSPSEGSITTSPPPLHPKLRDIDDLTRRFEALKAKR